MSCTSESLAVPKHVLPPHIQAYLWALLGGVLFSLVYAFPKLAESAPAVAWIVFIRYFGGFLTILPATIRYRRQHGRIIQSGLLGHLARAGAGLGAAFFLFYAVQVIPMATAISVSMTDGAICLVLASFILKERIGLRRAFAVAVSLFGAIVIINPSIGAVMASVSTLGALAALAAAVFIALESITYRYLATRESALSIVLHLNGISALIAFGVALNFEFPRSISDYWPILFMGPIAALGQLANVRAYALQEASFLAPIHYSGLIFSGLIGYFIFAEIPTMQSFIGMGFILFGAAIVLYVKVHPRRSN